MIGHILRHEWRTLAADASIWVVVVTFAAAIGYGTLNGVRWVHVHQHAIAEAQREERERFDRHEAEIRRINVEHATVSSFSDPRNPDTAGRRLAGRYAVLPPTPLAALSVGQSDLLPSSFRMTTDSRETMTGLAALENPHRLLTGRFDLAFVLVYLYPLLILAISYNLLSGEKEQGTLALALSQPVALRTLAIGKVTLRFGVIAGAIVALTVVALLVAGIGFAAPGVAPRLGLWVLAVAAYGLFWFAVAFAVSSAGRSSSTNAMVLAALWLLFSVVVPSSLSLLVNVAYPVPSRVEMVQALRAASDEANSRGSELLAQFYQDHPELAAGSTAGAVADFNAIRVAVTTDVERQVRPVLDTYERQLASQQRVVDRLRFLSPALLMQDALNDIAGTGSARHRHFMAQVGQYHEQWREYFVPLVLQRAQLEDLSSVPRFTYADEPLAAVASRVGVGLAALLLAAAVCATLGLRALRRYPVVG